MNSKIKKNFESTKIISSLKESVDMRHVKKSLSKIIPDITKRHIILVKIGTTSTLLYFDPKNNICSSIKVKNLIKNLSVTEAQVIKFFEKQRRVVYSCKNCNSCCSSPDDVNGDIGCSKCLKHFN